MTQFLKVSPYPEIICTDTAVPTGADSVSGPGASSAIGKNIVPMHVVASRAGNGAGASHLCLTNLGSSLSQCPLTFTITTVVPSVTNGIASGIYSGTTGGGNNAYTGMLFIVSGCQNAANNGMFYCLQSGTTQIILANPNAVSESGSHGSAVSPHSLAFGIGTPGNFDGFARWFKDGVEFMQFDSQSPSNCLFLGNLFLNPGKALQSGNTNMPIGIGTVNLAVLDAGSGTVFLGANYPVEAVPGFSGSTAGKTVIYCAGSRQYIQFKAASNSQPSAIAIFNGNGRCSFGTNNSPTQNDLFSVLAGDPINPGNGSLFNVQGTFWDNATAAAGTAASVAATRFAAPTYAAGSVVSFTITNGGSGYTIPPLVTLSGGSPTAPAVVFANISGGAVVSFTIVYGGTGYTSAPSVAFSGGGGGSGAAATAVINGTGGLVTVTDAATVKIDSAPTAGANAAITNPWSLWVGGGKLRLDSGAVIGKYNGVATVDGGVPAEYGHVDLTAQSAAIAATTILSAPTAGMYRITWSAKVTTPATTSSTLGGTGGLQILYTDNDDSVVVTTPAWWGGDNNGAAPTSAAGNTAQTQVSGVIIVNAKAATNIQYQFGYTSAGATAMQYSLHIKVEAM